MYRFQAIIRPQKAEQVFLDLARSGVVDALQAEECQGSGTRHVGPGGEGGLLPKVIIAGVIDDEHVALVQESLRTHASTGRSGDGKLFLLPVDQVS